MSPYTGKNDRRKPEDTFKYWIFIVTATLGIFAYVWSSATRFQTIESRSLQNYNGLIDVKRETQDKFNRIDDKLDYLIKKAQGK